jgi:xanthine dehydrogenase YagS FAD-binding subunit
MRPFSYQKVDDARAIGGRASADDPHYIAGGTTILDLMKLDVMRPDRLIDITPLAETAEFGQIEATDSQLRIGALVRMSDAADHPIIRKNYPVISQSLELAASQQLRNMATLGGNVLQRTRCPYFRDVSWSACNKRSPGTGCSAIQGFNRLHAVLGTSENCVATYPGDFAQALVALDADVQILGANGLRTEKFSALHFKPDDTPNIETALEPGDLLQGFVIEAGAWTRRSAYVKIRDRESYEFALASAAVALQLDGDVVTDARIALGGVATVPWRADDAEAALIGENLDEATAQTAANAAFADAQPLEHNSFKIQLGKATLVRALLQVKAMEI